MTPQRRAEIDRALKASEAARQAKRRRKPLSSATQAALERLAQIERINAAKQARAFATSRAG
jgi:hypothetical protein